MLPLRPPSLPTSFASVLAVSILLLAPGPPARAAAKVDLKRVQPVPAGEQIPIADFFRPLLLREPTMNRAGTHFAALVTAGEEDKYSLMVCSLEDSRKVETLEGADNRDIYNIRWISNEQILFSLLRNKQYGEGLFTGEVGRLRKSFPLIQLSAVRVLGWPDEPPHHPLVWVIFDANTDRGRDGEVVRIDSKLYTGGLISMAKANTSSADFFTIRDNNHKHVLDSYPIVPDGLPVGYLADKNGELEFGISGTDGYFKLHRWSERKWNPCPVDLDQVDLLTAGRRPGEIVVRGPLVPDHPRPLQFMDATTGERGDVLVQDEGYDYVGSVYRHPVTHEIIGVRYQQHAPHVVWLDEAYQQVQQVLDQQFRGRVASIIDSDDRGKIFLVATYSDRQPTIYFRVDLEKGSLGLVKASRPWIDPERMRPMTILKYKTADGRQLDAYLTLPAGVSASSPAPLVVLPHGGPWVRDTWGFDGEVQFLASRGYAVLQPNYRGSPGYDWMFPEEDQWAFRKMHDDVTAATKAVMAMDVIDAKRVAIMGWSFGGYLSVCGAAFEPDLYRCAVALAGIYDWERVMQDEKYYQFDGQQYATLRRRLGDPKREKGKFDEISPLRHVDRIRIPVFIAHGKDDTVASAGESRRLEDALDEHKIPHELMLVSGEGHGMRHIRNAVKVYERIESFLATNLAP